MIFPGAKVGMHTTGDLYRVTMIKLDERRTHLAYYLEPAVSMDAWVHLLPAPRVPLQRVRPDEVALALAGQTRWLECPWCHESHNHWCATSTPGYTFCTNCRGAQQVAHAGNPWMVRG
jgi:hypothetical protein